MVGVEDFRLAEFGQQVQVLAEALQLLVGFFGQQVAGEGMAVRRGLSMVAVLRSVGTPACEGRRDVGRLETALRRQAYSPCGCCIRPLPTQSISAGYVRESPDIKNPPELIGRAQARRMRQ
ncbi:hypothetical protein CSC73_14235 [Pseudoxanthomonas sacheonensis]|nr:hypothetical protein CSC73_14235 [Pseudoxanthomonas sacheonensis]